MENEVLKTILNRKSIRSFEDKKIDEIIIEQIMTAASSGPNPQNFQPYTFIEITDETRTKLAQMVSMPHFATSARSYMLAVDFNKLFIGATLEQQKIMKENLSSMHWFNDAVIAAGIAADNFVLAANSFGLGVVTMSGPTIPVDFIQSELELPEFVAPILALSVGYPKQDPGIKPKLSINGGSFMKGKYQQVELEKAISEYNITMKDYYAKRGMETDWTQHNINYLTTGNSDTTQITEYLRKKGFGTK